MSGPALFAGPSPAFPPLDAWRCASSRLTPAHGRRAASARPEMRNVHVLPANVILRRMRKRGSGRNESTNETRSSNRGAGSSTRQLAHCRAPRSRRCWQGCRAELRIPKHLSDSGTHAVEAAFWICCRPRTAGQKQLPVAYLRCPSIPSRIKCMMCETSSMCDESSERNSLLRLSLSVLSRRLWITVQT